jgi:ATP-binding protein involved in chromosome partitioning
VVAVTSPETLAVADTRRGVRAFQKLEVPVLGLIENLSGFVCDACGHEAALFGQGHGRDAARDLGIPFLGRVPVDPAVVPGGDHGQPVAAAAKPGPAARAFTSIARELLARLALAGGGTSAFELTWERGAAVRRQPASPPAASGTPERPDAIWQASDDTLGILWGDRSTTFHAARALRLACPCAACREEWTGRELPSLAEVPADVRPVTIRSVGRYALMPAWSDGHRTGMFTFRDLRAGVAGVPHPPS